jgi:hypothetical protein
MRPIQPLVRLPHSHIDPNWPLTVKRGSLYANVPEQGGVYQGE